MSTEIVRGVSDDNPLVNYAGKALWGNPENDKQFQVSIKRVTTDIGAIGNFNYMGAWRMTPLFNRRFHVFTAGGTHPGMWNFAYLFKTRNPINKWINASVMAKRRGVQVDFYNNLGRQYPRTKTWILCTQDGLVLIAFEHINNFDVLPVDDMHFRCYSTDLDITKSTNAMADTGNPYVFESMTYENPTELGVFATRLSVIKSRPGYTGVFINGYKVPAIPPTSQLVTGDVVEIWHDPTIKRVLYYSYKTLNDFYSDLDAKRKFILHPPKDGDFTFRYFDDNDYYLVDGNGKGVYFHRNNVNAIRQLTHVDVAIAIDQIEVQRGSLPELSDDQTLRIMVLERDTKWTLQWPWESQRIKYLYRMDDANIVKAMTGDRSVMPEWTANELEGGPVMTYVRAKHDGINTELVNQALGYNAETLAMSKSPISGVVAEGRTTIDVPTTFVGNSTVWEYDADGYLLGFYGILNKSTITPKYTGCAKVEFIYGQPSRNIHYDVTNLDLQLTNKAEFRVYTSSYSILLNQLTGVLKDVTGTDVYHVDASGLLVWDKLDKVNQRGVVVYNDVYLCHTLSIDHIDHSLAFSLDDLYTKVTGNLAISFAQIDVIMNGKTLIDKVDWLFKDRRIFINNRQHIVEGPQTVVVRCYGQWSDPTQPKTEVELGYMEGGVIGNGKRYNVREDRATRIVINGRLMLPGELNTSELGDPNDYNNPLNGFPYMVKHTYAPVNYAKDYDQHYLYDASRATDKRVSDYLTLYAVKPTISVDFNMREKYLMYSPFMNVVANAIINGVLTVPAKPSTDEFYPDQTISELVQLYKWWLPYDPITLKFDLRYFGILPFANIGKLTVTSDQFTFLKQVNKLYLNNVLSIEGYFEVAQHV